MSVPQPPFSQHAELAPPLAEQLPQAQSLVEQQPPAPVEQQLPLGAHLAAQTFAQTSSQDFAPAHTVDGPTAVDGDDLERGRVPAVSSSSYNSVPVRLTVHSVEGSLCACMSAPFLQIHIVDAVNGSWRLRSSNSIAKHAIYNLDKSGAPYLRFTPSRSEPWSACAGTEKQIRPFATVPATIQRSRRGGTLAPPVWDESFLLADGVPPGGGSMLLLEIWDCLEEHGHARRRAADGGTEESEDHALSSVRYERLAWAFLDLDSATAAPKSLRHRGRRLRLQLHKYRFRAPKPYYRNSSEADADTDATDLGRAGVFVEYRRDAREPGETMSRLRSVWNGISGFARSTERQKWPAVLEISVESAPALLESASQFDAVSIANRGTSASVAAAIAASSLAASTVLAAEIVAEPAGSGGEESAAEPEEDALKAHHERHGDEPCLLPDGLLWQISAGKRGAFRLAFSPSGNLLAAAVAQHGGTYELRIFNVHTGRLHAACASAHDAIVYDLCWHAFGGAGVGSIDPASQTPLLISCGSDCIVQIFEVPEDPRRLRGGLLRPHLRIQLTSHVYSVRPHPALSADPQQIVLACGGHNFGVAVCRVTRYWHPEMGADSSWIPGQPILEYVDYTEELANSGSQHALAPDGFVHKSGGHPAVLCVRFSGQALSPDNLYVTDAVGHLLLFQVRFDASLDGGRGGVRASCVRLYSLRELSKAPIYSLEVVTYRYLHRGENRSKTGQALHSTADDYLLLHARDHTVRVVSLQRGAARLETEMSGLRCGTYPVRGTMSPDGAYVACGCETGQLLCWNAKDGKPVAGASMPRVQLAGPVMDVAWNPRYHMFACCALDAHAPPLLVFVGGDRDRPIPKEPRGILDSKARDLPPRYVPLMDATPPPRLGDPIGTAHCLALAVPTSVCPTPAPGLEWAARWLDTSNSNPRSVISAEEKCNMKERILRQCLERKKIEDMDRSHLGMRALPPPLVGAGA